VICLKPIVKPTLKSQIEGDNETPRLRTELQFQQTRLRAKVVQIAGIEALKELDDKRNTANDTPNIPTQAVTAASTDADSASISTSTTSAYSSLPARISNEQLGHELLINPAFALDKHGGRPGENSVHAKIRCYPD
jgi:hypothetical protein